MKLMKLNSAQYDANTVNEFKYFFGMQKTVMKWPREQSSKECLKLLSESGAAGAFFTQISSNFVHEAMIEHRTLSI